jgi:hypothetical protein
MAGEPLCCVCGKPETVDHIFFECCFSQFLWCCIRDAFGWEDFPVSKHDFVYDWVPRRLRVPRRLALFFFAGFTWEMWKNRNKMAIEKKIPSNPDVVLYNTINSLQMWRDFMKEADKVHLSKMVEHLEDWISKRDHRQDFNSDIAVL